MEPKEDSSKVTPPATQIIPRQEHPITLDMIDRDALRILKKLNSSGFSAYLVGGGVRDLYLGNTPKDFDISTDARPGQIRKLFPNSKTIGRRFRLVQVFCGRGKVIEISTLRSLSEHDLDGPEAVLAPNNTFGTLEEDAQRRDLTINSLFYEIEQQTIIDYVNGVKDLDNSIIRIVGEPEKRVNRDPVRMLRAIRHCGRNNFSIEAESWRAICDTHQKLQLCPPSRLRDELLKDIYSGASQPWFELAAESGIFFSLFPIYSDLLYEKGANGQSCYEQLHKTFGVIDRINTLAIENGQSRQPDFFHLALILRPWTEITFAPYSQPLKGSALYQIGKKIRTSLDHELAIHLNLRRSLRQDMTVLLTNLSHLIHHRQKNSWPKWLRKKSYFNRCALFYHCYRETQGDTMVQESHLGTTHTSHNKNKKGGKNQKSSKKHAPAFAPKSKKGVFGFKK